MSSGIVPGMASRNIESKTAENRARRAAERQGLALRKSRRRDSRAVDFGRYWLIDGRTQALVFGDQFGATLEEVEERLGSR